MMRPLIELDDVWKSYEMGDVAVHALKEVSLDLYSGEVVVILGPSGSGKTTLLNLIGGIDHPTKGTLIVNGTDVGRLSGKELTRYRKKNIGFIFQFVNLIPNLTARENVEFVLEYVVDNGKGSRMNTQGCLDRVGLGDRGDHFPYQLSGGEQQRVSIARAVAKEPKIVLADEPTGELDHGTGLTILELLTSLVKEGKMVIIVTHDTDIARLGNRIIEFRDGRIVKVERNENPVAVCELGW